MFEIHMLPAAHGDCLWIEYGLQSKPHRILIDCGTGHTYPALRTKLEGLPAAKRKFELLVITHVDDDHIGGSLKLLAELEDLGVKIDEIWFNAYPHLDRKAILTGPDLLGARQGEALSELIVDRKIPWNSRFSGRAVVCELGQALPEHTLPGGMKITVLSPYWKQLEKMKTTWIAECKKAKLIPGQAVEEFIDDTLGTSSDVIKLANAPFDPDAAPANGSSIAFLAEYDNQCVLFGADAYAPVLEKSLVTLGYGPENRLPLSAFKAPHHGSQHNCSAELMKTISAETVLISSNGDKFYHPDREAIARMVVHNTKGATIYFNYLTEFNEFWSKPAIQLKHDFKAAYPEDGEQGKQVKL